MIQKILALTATAALVSGCATTPSNPQPRPEVATAASTTQPPKANEPPLMFSEAKLPRGFPQVGPLNEVIVKSYPAARSAVVRAAAVPGGNQNGLFMPLFNHIKKNHIPMSSPVEMRLSEAAAGDGAGSKPVAMAFIYGDPQTGTPGADGIVEVVDVPPMKVVSVCVRGSYDAEQFKSGIDRIQKWLGTHEGQYKVVGPPRFLGYNSPFVPFFLRIGEVQLPVTEVGTAGAPG